MLLVEHLKRKASDRSAINKSALSYLTVLAGHGCPHSIHRSHRPPIEIARMVGEGSCEKAQRLPTRVSVRHAGLAAG